MKEQWLKLKEWWTNLALREKRAVVVLGAFLGVFIVYAWIWSPLHNSVLAERKRIETDQQTLAWMESADKQIQKMEGQSKNKGKTVTPVILLGILQKQIAEAGLEQQLTQLKQATNDSVEMHFQKVEFDKLIPLLVTVMKENAVSITQMSAVAESTSGLVTADVILRLD